MAFGITYDAVSAAGEQLHAQNTALSTVVDNMKATAQRHFAEWNALSVATYTDAHTKWDNQATIMQTDLDRNIKHLYDIIAHYQDGDRRAAGGL